MGLCERSCMHQPLDLQMNRYENFSSRLLTSSNYRAELNPVQLVGGTEGRNSVDEKIGIHAMKLWHLYSPRPLAVKYFRMMNTFVIAEPWTNARISQNRCNSMIYAGWCWFYYQFIGWPITRGHSLEFIGQTGVRSHLFQHEITTGIVISESISFFQTAFLALIYINAPILSHFSKLKNHSRK